MLFCLLTSFIICHDICDCWSSIMFLILLIWPWIYSSYSFCTLLVNSHCTFSFSTWAFAGFLLLNKDAFSMLSSFSVIPVDFYKNFHICNSKYIFQISPEEYHSLLLTVTIYCRKQYMVTVRSKLWYSSGDIWKIYFEWQMWKSLLETQDQSYVVLTVCTLLLCGLCQIFAKMILLSEL